MKTVWRGKGWNWYGDLAFNLKYPVSLSSIFIHNNGPSSRVWTAPILQRCFSHWRHNDSTWRMNCDVFQKRRRQEGVLIVQPRNDIPFVNPVTNNDLFTRACKVLTF